MGLIVRVAGEARVVSTPWFRLALTPSLVEVPVDSVSMDAVFTVSIDRDPEHNKAVYLDLLGLAGRWSFSSDQFVPGVDTPVILTIDMMGLAAGFSIPFEVAGYDDINDRPVQPPPEE